MAFNPVAIVRDIESSQEIGRQCHCISGYITANNTWTATIETGMKSLLMAVVFDETGAAVVATTRGDSSVKANTKTVTFAVAVNKKYSYYIIGLYGRTATADTISNHTTITYNPTQHT